METVGDFKGFVVYLVFKGLGFGYLTPLFFFSDPILFVGSSVSVEGCKRVTEGRKKREQDTF